MAERVAVLLRNLLQLCNQLLRCCAILGCPLLQDSSSMVSRQAS